MRGLSFIRPPGEARYHLRLTVEPELEDAEVEPNDDCAQASLVKLAAVAGGPSEGEIAGFLWPGDVDCFRLRPPSAGPAQWQLKLALPGGDCQAALDLGRGNDPTAKAVPDGAGGLGVHARGDPPRLGRAVGRHRRQPVLDGGRSRRRRVGELRHQRPLRHGRRDLPREHRRRVERPVALPVPLDDLLHQAERVALVEDDDADFEEGASWIGDLAAGDLRE